MKLLNCQIVLCRRLEDDEIHPVDIITINVQPETLSTADRSIGAKPWKSTTFQIKNKKIQETSKARFRRRISHVPNVMQMSKTYCLNFIPRTRRTD
jgi:hypothetical protein